MNWLQWIMLLPIFLSSLFALAIIIERSLTLRRSRVLPLGLRETVLNWLPEQRQNYKNIEKLRDHSPLGAVFAAALEQQGRSINDRQQAIEQAGRYQAHLLEKHLSLLGSIAGIAPMLGLLGTVVGMIQTFEAITVAGVGDATTLAHGISTALLTTAFGLVIAIPSLLFYRHFRHQIDSLLLAMEQETLAILQHLDAEALEKAEQRRRS